MGNPVSRERTRGVPPKTVAVVALMRVGIHDLALIAKAVGLKVEQVEHIEAADDPAVRQLAVQGIPDEFIYYLRTNVTCPTCGNRIYLIPCLACKINQPQSA